MREVDVNDRRRLYRLSGFVFPGGVGDGGPCYPIGARYATEQKAIEAAQAEFRRGGDVPERILICRHAQEACWVLPDGSVVRRELKGLEGIWGYAS